MWKVNVRVVSVVLREMRAVIPKLGERLQQISGITLEVSVQTTLEVSVQTSAVLGRAKILCRTLRPLIEDLRLRKMHTTHKGQKEIYSFFWGMLKRNNFYFVLRVKFFLAKQFNIKLKTMFLVLKLKKITPACLLACLFNIAACSGACQVSCCTPFCVGESSLIDLEQSQRCAQNNMFSFKLKKTPTVLEIWDALWLSSDSSEPKPGISREVLQD